MNLSRQHSVLVWLGSGDKCGRICSLNNGWLYNHNKFFFNDFLGEALKPFNATLNDENNFHYLN